VDSLVARDVVTTTPDGPLRIGRIALGGLVAYQRTDGTAQQADDVKLRELLVENVTIPGRPVITIGRLSLNAYGSGQLSRGEVSDITMTDIPEDPIDGASIGRFSFSGINLAGLASDAVLADIKKAFRQQAALHHPDRNSAPEAPARFRAVQAAYEVLSDPDRRQAYDDNRRRNLLDDPLQTASEIWQNYFKTIL
jgi:hypothetical protein